MAVKKSQHFIPRFLQRGFLASSRGERTFLYHRERGVTLLDIGKVGSENYFYSRPEADGAMILDDRITEEETKLAPEVKRLRSLEGGSEVEAVLAADLVEHFLPKTKNTRAALGALGSAAFQEMSSLISDVNNMARLLGLDAPIPNETWRKWRDSSPEFLATIELLKCEANLPVEVIDRWLFIASREIFRASHSSESSKWVHQFDIIVGKAHHDLKDRHNKALLRRGGQSKRQTALETFFWEIVEGPSGSFVLPDCVVLGRGTGDDRLLPLLLISGELSQVFLPISSDKLLVGARERNDLQAPQDFSLSAAQCSQEFFISPLRRSEFAAYVNEIGSEWGQQITRVIDFALGEYRPQKLDRQMNMISTESRGGNVEISSRGQGGELISSLLKPILETATRSLDLRALWEIRIVEDAGVAINSSAAGEVGDATFEVPIRHIVPGISMILVNDGGEFGTVLQLELSVIEGLLLEKGMERQSLAIATIFSGLAHVGAVAKLEADAPGSLLAPIPFSDHDRLIYVGVQAAILTYLEGRMAARLSDVALLLERDEEAIAIAVSKAADIAKAGAQNFKKTPDMQELFEQTIIALSDFLSAVGRFLGHRHGIGLFSDHEIETQLKSVFEKLGLVTWLPIFGSDLDDLWGCREITLQRLYDMNSHVERTIVCFGLLVYKDPATSETRAIVTFE